MMFKPFGHIDLIRFLFMDGWSGQNYKCHLEVRLMELINLIRCN